MYVLPRSLKNIYTAWQFSGQILFKCKANRDFKVFPSASDIIPAICCSLPSNENQTSDLSPFTVHRVSSGCWRTGCACPFAVFPLLVRFSSSAHPLCPPVPLHTRCNSVVQAIIHFPLAVAYSVLVHFCSLTLLLPIHHVVTVTFTNPTMSVTCLNPAWNW